MNSARKFIIGTLVILTLIFTCNSCRKTKTVEVEKEVIVYQEPIHSWKKIKNFTNMGNELIRNVQRASGGFVYFVGYNYNAVYDSVTNSFTFLSSSNLYTQLKPLMTDKFYTQSNLNSVYFLPHNNLPSFPYNWTEKLLYPSTYDSDFLQITGFSGTFFSSYAIASNTLIMLVYQSKRITNNYLAIKVSYPPVYEENDFSIKIEETKVICDTLGPSANHLIGPVGKNLMFTFGNNKNYLLNGNMDTTFLKNSYQFNQIFEWKGNQYSFANVVDSGYIRTCLVRSSDEGYNWEIIAAGLSYHYRSLYFSHIGNKLIANSFGNQIWEIEISNNGVTSKELVNDGLADVKIKAITYSNNKVFVATETGVFERSLNEFIEYK